MAIEHKNVFYFKMINSIGGSVLKVGYIIYLNYIKIWLCTIKTEILNKLRDYQKM